MRMLATSAAWCIYCAGSKCYCFARCLQPHGKGMLVNLLGEFGFSQSCFQDYIVAQRLGDKTYKLLGSLS